MTIAYDFSAFVDGLSTEEREALGGALQAALLAVSLADEDLSFFEIVAWAKGTLAGIDALGGGMSTLAECGAEVLQREANGWKQQAVQLKKQIAAATKAANNEGGDLEGRSVEGEPPFFVTMLKLVGPIVDRGRPILEKMPPPVREAFEDNAAAMLVQVAEASGGFLWWGEKISAEERAVASKLFSMLGITVRDAEVRKKFGLDAPEG